MFMNVSTHSRPKAAGQPSCAATNPSPVFQLTAARRRLDLSACQAQIHQRFNSQPPEGGWASGSRCPALYSSFNSQPPEGGWYFTIIGIIRPQTFQLTAARRRLGCRCP